MSAEERRKAFDAMHSKHATEIDEFFKLPHISGMEFGEDLTDTQQRRIRALVFSFRHTCAVPGVVKTLRGATFSLKTTEGGPVQTPLRREGKLRGVVGEHLKKMLDEKVIRVSKSPWSAGICLTPERKPDGTIKYRFCISYVQLNALTPKDAFVNPPCEEGLELLGGHKFFSTLDMKSAYWTIPMEDDGSIEKTAFITSEGLFEFLRMPFGLKNAGAAYCRYAAQVFAGLRWQNLLSYVDDQLVFSKTFDDHLEHLFDAFGRISRANMSIGAAKCAFAMPQVPYLGYIVTRDGVKPNPKRASAITQMTWPTTTKRWLHFLGVANTYRRFIKNHARVVKPIQDWVARMGVSGKFPRSRDKCPPEICTAYDEVVSKITNEPALSHPDFDYPFTLETDGSNDGLGAELTQTIDKKKRTIMFCSRSLKPAEKNYTPYERECLAFVWATDVLRPYLIGAHFDVVTDNVAVSVVFKEKKKNQQRLVPWRMKLQQYDFTICQKPRDSIVVPDALAKAATHPPGYYGEPDLVMATAKAEAGKDWTTGITRTEFLSAQLQDPQCAAIRARLLEGAGTQNTNGQHRGPQKRRKGKDQTPTGTPAEKGEQTEAQNKVKGAEGSANKGKPLWEQFFVRDDLLYRQPLGKWLSPRIVVPTSMRLYILREFHGSGLAGHSGKHRTTGLIGEYFYWQKMHKDVANFVNACIFCRQRKRPKPNRQGEVGQLIVGNAFDTLAMDIIVGLPDDKGYKHILSIIDVFTRYAWAIPIRDRGAISVADSLANHVFQHHGSFRVLRTDNESSFTSEMMQRLYRQWGITHLTTVPYHSESNGHVERLHQFLETQLTILAKERTEWTRHVQACVFAYNVGVHTSTGYSPYFLMHGRRPRLPVEFILGTRHEDEEDTHDNYARKLTRTIAEAYRRAREEQIRAADRRKARQTKKRIPTVFKVNDMVMLHRSERGTAAKHLPAKLSKNASGPHRVVRRIDANRYCIAHTTMQREITVSVKDISLYHPFEDENQGTGEVQALKIGDLAIIPVRPNGIYHPFYVARIIAIGRKTVTAQWFGNIEDRFLGPHLPEWSDGNDGYFSAEKEAPTHTPVTNKDTGPVNLSPNQIAVFGFELTGDHHLTPETIAIISDEPSVKWNLPQRR